MVCEYERHPKGSNVARLTHSTILEAMLPLNHLSPRMVV